MDTSRNEHENHAPIPDKKIGGDLRQLRILSIEVGTDYHVRLLSEAYGGLFTHYARKSFLCTGEKDCPSHIHKYEKIWKGYAAVDIWLKERKVWLPFVLEISEHLELDFRGLWKRGQVWEIWRDHPVAKKPSPVQAKLQEEREPDRVPKAFDFVSVLKTRYHTSYIDLTAKNPLPPRVFVEESAGDGPAVLATKDEKASVPFDSFAAEFQRQANARKKTPTEKKAQ